MLHAGTTDVDVQVNLEIASGAVNVVQLERALVNAGFEPEQGNVWRWRAQLDGRSAVVKFELLADLDDQPADSVVSFRDCDALGAVNLRGTGFATRDYMRRPLRSEIDGDGCEVEVNVTGLAGFLLAKIAATYRRRKDKDWYDIAFVLLHNDAGGPVQAATITRDRFGMELTGEIATALDDLLANFATPEAQGPAAYASQMGADYPNAGRIELRADALLAVRAFHTGLFSC